MKISNKDKCANCGRPYGKHELVNDWCPLRGSNSFNFGSQFKRKSARTVRAKAPHNKLQAKIAAITDRLVAWMNDEPKQEVWDSIIEDLRQLSAM